MLWVSLGKRILVANPVSSLYQDHIILELIFLSEITKLEFLNQKRGLMQPKGEVQHKLFSLYCLLVQPCNFAKVFKISFL